MINFCSKTPFEQDARYKREYAQLEFGFICLFCIYMEGKLYQVTNWEHFYHHCFLIVFFSFLTHLTIFQQFAYDIASVISLSTDWQMFCRFGWIRSHKIFSILNNSSKTIIFLMINSCSNYSLVMNRGGLKSKCLA